MNDGNSQTCLVLSAETNLASSLPTPTNGPVVLTSTNSFNAIQTSMPLSLISYMPNQTQTNIHCSYNTSRIITVTVPISVTYPFGSGPATYSLATPPTIGATCSDLVFYYSIVQGPDFVSINSATGEFTWETSDPVHLGDHEITFFVSINNNQNVVRTFQLVVEVDCGINTITSSVIDNVIYIIGSGPTNLPVPGWTQLFITDCGVISYALHVDGDPYTGYPDFIQTFDTATGQTTLFKDILTLSQTYSFSLIASTDINISETETFEV